MHESKSGIVSVFFQTRIYCAIAFLSLLDSGNDRWNKCQWGDTALIHATKSGYTDCVQLLLQSGANKDAANKVRISVSARVSL